MAREVSKSKGEHFFFIYLALWVVSPLKNGLRSSWEFCVDRLTVLLARALGKPLIHVIGDSHVIPFRGSIPFLAHHLGAATAYNLIKKGSSTRSNEKLFKIVDKLGRNDIAILCFGEIDCRIHIYYQHRKSDGRYSVEDLINRTVANYGEIMGQLKQRGVNFFIHCVSPATEVGNEYKYPFYGTPEVRSRINRAFNERLKAFCAENGYGFIDIYDKVADENGLMLKEYAGDEIHLNKKAVKLARAELRKAGVKV
jgi:lysophospholipase L1-like esterase